MKDVIKMPNSLPIKMWMKKDDLESGALQQAFNLSKLPFAFKHIALMPDCHQGYGMPIGGVLATKGVVVPNAVGVDIGCGMTASKTGFTFLHKNALEDIVKKIQDTIPVGMDRHIIPARESEMPLLEGNIEKYHIVREEYDSARHQLGTLGGGNHFIEIQEGSDGYLWVMIHSGSRNLGKKVADYYNEIAKKENEMWHSAVPKEFDLAFLPLNSDEGKMYLKEMRYCVEFARANRRRMMKAVAAIMDNLINSVYRFSGVVAPFYSFEREFYDVAHNYAAMENHSGSNVMIHRKGAIRAQAGEIGIIPGSQGTASYIVSGLGNTESFNSSSHGSGRAMSRTAARKNLNLQDEIRKMDELDIVHGIQTEEDLDEAAGAYKDINVVMKNQQDLVQSIIELKPLAVIKG